MKIKKILLSILALVVLILELLPGGVVLRFANPEGEPWVKTYSYFNMTPFGYANFGPFITAVMTCVLIVLIIIAWFKYSRGLNVAIKSVTAFATVTSLMPIMFGAEYLTGIGVAISILLGTILGVCFVRGEIT